MSDADEITALARRAVETFVQEKRLLEAPPELSGSLRRRAACFVSIKKRDGDLRGCIGTVEPLHEQLAEEIIANAVSAATRDPRFPPVSPAEIPHLRYSIDVLSKPVPTLFEELDPKIYGVIVEDEAGLRRGLLLPDIEGVSSAAQQIEIAVRKACIPPGSALKLLRFSVERYREF